MNGIFHLRRAEWLRYTLPDMDYAEALVSLDGWLRLGIKLGNERFAALLGRLE